MLYNPTPHPQILALQYLTLSIIMKPAWGACGGDGSDQDAASLQMILYGLGKGFKNMKAGRGWRPREGEESGVPCWCC